MRGLCSAGWPFEPDALFERFDAAAASSLAHAAAGAAVGRRRTVRAGTTHQPQHAERESRQSGQDPTARPSVTPAHLAGRLALFFPRRRRLVGLLIPGREWLHAAELARLTRRSQTLPRSKTTQMPEGMPAFSGRVACGAAGGRAGRAECKRACSGAWRSALRGMAGSSDGLSSGAGGLLADGFGVGSAAAVPDAGDGAEPPIAAWPGADEGVVATRSGADEGAGVGMAPRGAEATPGGAVVARFLPLTNAIPPPIAKASAPSPIHKAIEPLREPAPAWRNSRAAAWRSRTTVESLDADV